MASSSTSSHAGGKAQHAIDRIARRCPLPAPGRCATRAPSRSRECSLLGKAGEMLVIVHRSYKKIGPRVVRRITQLDGAHHRRRRRVNIELAVGVLDVRTDRIRGDAEHARRPAHRCSRARSRRSTSASRPVRIHHNLNDRSPPLPFAHFAVLVCWKQKARSARAVRLKDQRAFTG